MERDQAMALVERHRPAPLWRLLGLWRCAGCRRRWPCLRYRDARSALLCHDRHDVAAVARRLNTRWPTP
ncbi:hypothetical protein [Plantactinospora sp. B5E13]|uniref:hypothetical protein n=1 Tax=unclassified Plantactinospora TaxID=2631981 RepID=UPI00325F5AD7